MWIGLVVPLSDLLEREGGKRERKTLAGRKPHTPTPSIAFLPALASIFVYLPESVRTNWPVLASLPFTHRRKTDSVVLGEFQRDWLGQRSQERTYP